MYRTTYALTPELVREYDELIGTDARDGRRPTPGSANGDPVPPWVFCAFAPLYDALGGRFDQGTVHLKHRLESFGGARVGDELDVEVRVAEKYVRKGRDHAVLEMIFPATGAPACRITSTFLWGFAKR
ncbi:MAG: hypothetical protein GEV11_25670 [Streptosporangiales bacterium]|nr:hypothetical protein [Streptosporangiales bacterium]